MRCFRIAAFAAVVFGEKALCRAIHDGASTLSVSIVSSTSSSSASSLRTISVSTSSPLATPSSISSSPSTFITSPITPSSSPLPSPPSITQAQPQITASSSASPITTATTRISPTISDTKGEETATHLPTTQPTSANTTAQIVAIAIGSSAIVGIVATFFFFAGRRSNRRPSLHNITPNIGSFRTKLDKRWKKNSDQNTHSIHAPTAPAELGTAAEVREVSLPPERPVNNQPYFYHPVTVASPLAGELDDRRVISSNPPPAARLHTRRIEALPVELPTFCDPENTPLPEYDELDAARRQQIFSWAAPEATYRPDKFAPSNMI